MFEWLDWFTYMENSKVAALLIFFTVFCAILVYVYASKGRSKRLESYKYIPLQDESDLRAGSDSKVIDDGRDQEH